MSRDSLPILSLGQTRTAIISIVKADRAALVYGPPGIGKTSIMAGIAAELGLPLEVMIASNYEAVDIGGLPVPHGKTVERHVFGSIARACREAVCLTLDEFTTCAPSASGPLLRLTLERVAGDHKLHEGTVIVALTNAPEHAPGGVELSAAQINRFITLRCLPSIDEVESYFNASDCEAMQDFAILLRILPELLQLEPPSASVEGGAPWGSPRAWEAGLRAWAKLARSDAELGLGRGDHVGYAILAGAVGAHAAAEFLGVMEARKELPTFDQVAADPFNALVPTKKHHQIAAMSLLRRMQKVDAGAAWIYLDRLDPEIRNAAARIIFAGMWKEAKWHKEGSEVRRRVIGEIHKLIGGKT